MNTSDTSQFVAVATPDHVIVRLAPAWALGEPVAGVACPPLAAAEEMALRLLLSGVPTTHVAETLDFPLSEARKLSAQFDVGANDAGVVYAKIVAAYKQGANKAELEREYHVLTRIVTAALYLHQLITPPGKAADEAWCVRVAKKYVNRVPISELVRDEACSEAEIRAAILWAGILAPAVPGVPISHQRACNALHPISSRVAARTVRCSDTEVKKIWARDGKDPLGRPAWSKYHYNKDSFLTLDPETEYWIGYAFADGTSPGSEKFSIKAAMLNRYHLIRFNNFLGGDNLPRTEIVHLDQYDRDYPIARLDICCVQIVKNLYGWGFRPNKRYFTMADVVLDDRLIRSPHFLRGYFDGNGGISATKRCYIDISSPLRCVHRAYDTWLKQFAPPEQVEERKWVDVGRCWNLSLSTKPAQRLMNFMYFDAAGAPYFPALKCKLELARQWRESNFDDMFGPEEIADVITSHLAGETFAAIAARYDCSPAHICNTFHGTCHKKLWEQVTEGLSVAIAA